MADEDISDAALDAVRASELAAREKAVDAALRSGKAADAVRAALEKPAFASKDAGIKERSSACALKALVALGQKDAELAALLDAIDSDTADVLMKYIYKGLQKADNSGLLLKIHAQLVEKCGPGCIVRAITDRKTA